MKKLLKSIWEWVSNLWNKLDAETKKWAPVAINAVDGIKKVMDGPVDDIIAEIVKAAIPGNADDVAIDHIKKTIELWLPKILFELRLINSIAGLVNPQEQLKAIFENLRLSSNETQNMVLHGFAVLLIEKLADGKLTWSECVHIAEYAFKNREALKI